MTTPVIELPSGLYSSASTNRATAYPSPTFQGVLHNIEKRHTQG